MTGIMMFQKIAVLTACSFAFVLTSSLTQAQFGGIQVQLGGFGRGVGAGNFGYGNGFYGRNGGGLGNQFYNGNQYYNRNQYFGNRYSTGYGAYNNFGNGGYYGNGVTYNRYSGLNYQSLGPRVYAAPMRSNAVRRYRYR